MAEFTFKSETAGMMSVRDEDDKLITLYTSNSHKIDTTLDKSSEKFKRLIDHISRTFQVPKSRLVY